MEEVEGLTSLDVMGSGGFADVYRAHEPAFSRDVAVKVFRDRVDERARRSFEREANAAGRLSGIRNVVHLYRSGITASGKPFLVMELMDGSVEDVLAGGPIPADAACAAGVVLGRALGEAHARGVLHRDIKPANVLIDRYGEPALSDFGIAGLIGSGSSGTMGGAFTAEHVAPEVLDGHPASEASDVYSLASTVFNMIEGHAPFTRAEGEGPLPFLRRVSESERPSAPLAAATSPELEATIRAGLAVDPATRPDLTEFVAALGVHARHDGARLAGAPSASPTHAAVGAPTDPPPTGKRSRRAIAVAAAAAALVIVGGAIAVVMAVDGDPPPEPPSTTVDQTTTTGGPADAPPRRPDGVSDLRELSDPSLSDTSGILRSHINSFASGSSLAVLDQPPLREVTGEDLDLGRVPSQFDYAATNKIGDTRCWKVYLDDGIVVGVAGSIWADGSQLVVVNAVQLESEQLARQYYWATSLFLGLRDPNCDGWPANKVAVNPERLEVTRQDFELGVAADDTVTVVNNRPDFEGVQAGIAYEAVVRSGTTVVVISVGFADSGAGADPASAAQVMRDVMAQFPPT